MIRGANPEQFENGLGIMTHANVTETVADFVREFPSSAGFYPHGDDFERDDESRYVTEDGEYTELGREIRENTVRIADSGIFTKEGSDFDSYEKLYEKYEQMGVEYGIILDAINDCDGTVEEAITAMETYEAGDYAFILVGVAQGVSLEEYLRCYQTLRDLGYEHIAVGGLLSKDGERTGAFAHVDNEEFMQAVLSRLREQYPDDWIFALGCHHPDRHHIFSELELFGADYKGWIYKYKRTFGGKAISDTRQAREWRFENVRSFVRHNIPQGTGDHPDRLVILPCSKTKSDAAERVAAEDRYQRGQYFQVYNKWRREHPASEHDVDLAIVSAKHGLISARHQIYDYDEVLDSRPEGTFLQTLESDLHAYLKWRDYSEVLVLGGANYREPVYNILQVLSAREVIDAQVVLHSGRLGSQLGKLKAWLRLTPEPSGQQTLEASVETTD
jgi:hypothetical protein